MEEQTKERIKDKFQTGGKLLVVACPAVSQVLSESLRQRLTNPNDNASTRKQRQWLKFKKRQWKRHGNKGKDLFRMKSNKGISLTGKTEGFIVATALPIRLEKNSKNQLIILYLILWASFSLPWPSYLTILNAPSMTMFIGDILPISILLMYIIKTRNSNLCPTCTLIK